MVGIGDDLGKGQWDGDFLENALALATAVFEAPTFGYTEAAPAQCFPKVRLSRCSC